jgi:hypothetical protein
MSADETRLEIPVLDLRRFDAGNDERAPFRIPPLPKGITRTCCKF